MVRRCLEGDRRFGVVLIARGSEVGGGDTRYPVGTLAHLVDAAELADGRWVLVAAGEQRLRVTRWLPDDPHPRASVEVLEDPPAHAGSEERDALQEALRRIAARQAALGDPAPPPGTEIAADPTAASYQAAALAPVGPLDLQRLLEIDDPDDRIAAVLAVLAEVEDLLRLRRQR